MTLVRVTVAGTIGKAVRINTDATIGAQIGTDLQLPDGTIPSLAELADALYIQSPPGEFIPDTGLSVGGHSHFESEIIDGKILARVADNEVITGAYRYDTNLTMENQIPINWRDSGGVKREFLNFSAGSGPGAAVGHIIKKITTGVTTTSTTFVDVTGAVVTFAEMEPNTNYAVFVRAYIGNSVSSSTAANKVVLTKNDIGVPGSEEVYESPVTTKDSVGMLYEWGGIVNSGSAGDLQLEHLSGNGAQTVFANNVTIMMIKVDDLGSNIVHSTDTGLVELDDGNFPPLVFFDSGVSITIGDGASDYLVFGSMRIDAFLSGGNRISMRVTDGTNTKKGSHGPRGDSTDELTIGFMQFWKAPAASTTLRVEAQGTGFPADKVYTSIIAIRLNAFNDYNGAMIDTTTDLGDGPTDMVTVAFTAADTANYGFIAGANGPDSGTVGAPQMIRNNLNGGGEVTIGGSATQKVTSNVVFGANDGAQFAVSADQTLTASDTIDADYHAPDAQTPIIWENAFLAVFQWNLVPPDGYNVGNDSFVTTIKGTTVNVTAPLTATSYDGVLAANLLDKSADEDIAGQWSFKRTRDGVGKYAISIESATPFQEFNRTGAGVDEGRWSWGALATSFVFLSNKDDDSTGTEWLIVNRTAEVVDNATFGVPILAISYDGVLAANLLDRTVNEIVTGRWDFESDGSAPQLCIVDSDSNGAATRAFIEFLGKGDVLTGRMGYLSAASGIFTIDNALPNAGVELKSAGVQKLRVDINGTTVTGTIFVDNTSGEKVVLRDTNSTGNAVLNFIAFNDMNDLRQGFIGFGSSSNSKLSINNAVGDIVLVAANTDITGALTATSYDGILAANLLDKSAAEIISEAYTFTKVASGTTYPITISSSTPFFTINETDAAADNQRWDFGVEAEKLRFRVLDDAGTATANWLTVDRTLNVIDNVDVLAPLTATSYDGILAANLLDKIAAETVSGGWTFTGINFQQTNPFIFVDNTELRFGSASDIRVKFDGVAFLLRDAVGGQTWNITGFSDITATDSIIEGNYMRSSVVTTANLASITNAINTSAGKKQGVWVWNSTTKKPVWADGNADGSLWYDATGTLAHTPV